MAGQPYRTRGIPEEWVEIKHPDVELPTRVAPSAVKHWEDRGWKVVSDTSRKSSKTSATKTEG